MFSASSCPCQLAVSVLPLGRSARHARWQPPVAAMRAAAVAGSSILVSLLRSCFEIIVR